MIVITTPTGQIGRQVLGHLLESGEQLRVIARDPSQLPAGVREDLDIVEGSHGDAAVADKAFAGADAVLWLTPADRRAPTVTVVRPRRPGRSWQRTAIIACSPYRASAHPERAGHQVEMPAPVEPWPRAHRADHAADQHRDVGRLYAGTDRPRAPGAFDQL